MKTYLDYLNELSIDDLRIGLLKHGMFADKLPDFLTMEDFYSFCEKHNFKKTYTSIDGWDYVRFNNMRNSNVPRELGIPTPFAYFNLCECIITNWKSILNHFQEKTSAEIYKRSQIHIQKRNSGPHLFEMSTHYKDVDDDLQEIITEQPISKQYCIQTDISTCFPSIYSHALPWALVGKRVAKSTRTNDSLWYNKLDKSSRHLKYNETSGLLIGPHTSNLLSEIILTTVDSELNNYQYVRYIDDITYYASDENEANKFLKDLSKVLKRYDLSLNAKKTNITKIGLHYDTSWKNQLNAFYIGNDKNSEGKIVFHHARLRAYVDLATSLVESNDNNAAIFTYVIKKISGYHLGKKARLYYVNTLHHLLLLYPYLIRWCDEYLFVAFSVDIAKIHDIAKQLYILGVNTNNFEACSYAIYWSIKYKFSLSDLDIVENAIDSEDCILLMLTYIKCNHVGDGDGQNKLIEFAKKIVSADEIDRYWIFVYEVLPADELKKEYKNLKKQKISFLKSEFKLVKKNKHSRSADIN